MEETFDEELEARLYAQVNHDTSEPAVPESSEYTPPNLNKQSGKRYWQKSKNLSTQNNSHYDNTASHNTYTQEKSQQTLPKTQIVTPAPQPIVLAEKESTAAPAIKTFVPYSSVLTFMSAPLETPPPRKETPGKVNNYEKKKTKITKFPMAGKLLNPTNKQGVTKGKSAMKIEVQAKKIKAIVARKKAQGKVLTTIELEDSDESDCIPIELPAPPLITLDSSDEETIKKKRAMSPSTSSIISDDFIVAGDKRRLVNPFVEGTPTTSKAAKKKENLQKLKALTQVPSSTSSSDSARSSCERNVKVLKVPTAASSETRSKRKVSSSQDNSNEDSIYCAKSKPAKNSKEKELPPDSSDEETICVNAKNQKSRRRKSTNSRKKSTEGDSDLEEDPKQILISSTPVVKKRSRLFTPSYNDYEFATMISSIVSGDPLEDEDDDEEESEEKTESPSATKAVITNKTSIPETITKKSIPSSTVVSSSAQEVDCVIIEQPVVVVEVPDDDEDKVVSDSDDSMKGFKGPVVCDLSLNVTQTPYEPHEFIRNGEGSRDISLPDDSSVNPEIGWNDEMKFFYDGRWGNVDFSISNILESMPRDFRNWKINNADRNRTMDSGSRIRCKKCNEIGHIAVKCTKPRKRIVCYMCGDEGHRETRCPNAICLRCGKPNRLFATVCQACQRLSRKNCPCCRFPGHDMENCPDKWRRYHSTTEDVDNLNSDYHINKRVFCSICARRGHFAENCQQFFKTINGLITSSCANIVSHKPSYPRQYLQKFDRVAEDQKQLLALFTYFPFYWFNFISPSPIYKTFKEQFLLHLQRTGQSQTRNLPAIQTSQQKKKSKNQTRKEKREAKRQKVQETPEPRSALQISVSSFGSRTVSAKTSPVDVRDDSNSNYSFSEFYVPTQQNHKSPDNDTFKSPGVVSISGFDKTTRSAKTPERLQEAKVNPIIEALDNAMIVKNPFAQVNLPDFIPLSRAEDIENLPQQLPVERSPEVSGEARVMLTKENYSMLKGEKGMNFLWDLQQRLNVVSQFHWDSTGNSLIITGIPSEQSMFHLEVREYLYQVELERHEKILENTSQLPKQKASIVSFMKLNLQSVNKLNGHHKIKAVLDALRQADKNFNFKKALKCRRSLNIAFMGHAELEDGGVHIAALRRILLNLERDLVQGKTEMTVGLRDEIVKHMKPIFSSMDHGDYYKLFDQYMKIMRNRRKQKLVLNPNAVLN